MREGTTLRGSLLRRPRMSCPAFLVTPSNRSAGSCSAARHADSVMDSVADTLNPTRLCSQRPRAHCHSVRTGAHTVGRKPILDVEEASKLQAHYLGKRMEGRNHAERSIHEIPVDNSPAERLISVCVGLGKVSSRVYLVLLGQTNETKSSNFMLSLHTSCHGIEQSQIPITSSHTVYKPQWNLQHRQSTYRYDVASHQCQGVILEQVEK